MSSNKNKKKDPVNPEEENSKIVTPEEEVVEVEGEVVEVTVEDKDAKGDTAPSLDTVMKGERDKFLRLVAEYDNYRKRSAKEREGIYSDVRADTVTKFLPVYDNLVRALEQSTEDEAYRKGVELIMAQFNEVLTRLGVTEIEAVGKEFDPIVHDAVMHEVDETKGENEIVMEFQKGFKMGDKVIRFAVVKVAN